MEEDEEMEREDERGVAKRPDLNELDVPEWAELALDKVERRKLLQRIALWRWRQRAAGRAQRLGCGVRLTDVSEAAATPAEDDRRVTW